MSAHQRRKAAAVGDLVELCSSRGITSAHLRQAIIDTYTSGTPVGSPLFAGHLERADNISNAGLTAQLSYLLDAWSDKKLRAFLQDTGGVLDAIVLHTSSSRAERDEDIGRDNVDEDGDVP